MYVIALIWLGAANVLNAQTRTTFEDFSTQSDIASSVKAEDGNSFGDVVDVASGATTFFVTDVSVPGNNDLAVAIQRSMKAYDDGIGGWFEWTRFDVPSLSGIYRAGTGWQGSDAIHPELRCSAGGAPEVDQSTGKTERFYSDEYWHGNYLNLPGEASRLMMDVGVSTPNQPTDGATYHWATKDRWFFSCLPALKNGITGEGFLARAPDGTKYYFDWLIKYGDVASIGKTAWQGGLTVLYRNEYRILATRVEDRFGNWVNYTYSGVDLSSIESNDLRKLTLTYSAPGGNLISVSDGNRSWSYVNSASAITVTHPDGSTWNSTLSGIGIIRPIPDCDSPMPANLYSGNQTVSIKTRSGATGAFVFAPVRTGISFVPYQGPNDGWCAEPHKTADNIGIASKSISGLGILSQTWNYNYGAPNDCFVHNGYGSPPVNPCAANAPTTRIVQVTTPTSFERYTMGNIFHDSDGALLKFEAGTNSSAILKSETYSWQLLNPLGTYSAMAGDPYLAVRTRVQDSRTLVQDGWQFSNKVESRDGFGRATRETKSSNVP